VSIAGPEGDASAHAVAQTMTRSASGALVTGGGSGIGLAIAEGLVRDGFDVVICGRTRTRLDEAVDHIDAAGHAGSIRAVIADVTDEDSVAAVVAEADSAPNGLRAVAAAAGGSESIGPVTQLDRASWER